MSELEIEMKLLDCLKQAVLLRDAKKFDAVEKKNILALTIADDDVKKVITGTFRSILTSGLPIKEAFTEFSWFIGQLMPEIRPSIGFDQNNKYHEHTVYEHMLYVADLCNTDRFPVKLAALFHDIGKPAAAVLGDDGYTHYHGHPNMSCKICREMFSRVFDLSNSELEYILKLIALHDRVLVPDIKSVKRFINRHGRQFFEDWLVLKKADIDDHVKLEIGQHCPDIEKIKEIYREILDEEKRFKLSDLAVNGNDLISIGIPKGKEIGEMLDLLMEKVKRGLLPNLKNVLLMYCVSMQFEHNPLGVVS